MKVLLVGINAKYIHKNLAIRYISQACPSQHACSIMEYTIKDSVEEVARKILDFKAEVIGISTYIWNVDFVKNLTEYIKSINSSVNIFLGGPEVSFEQTYFLENFSIDAVSAGEGEFTVWEYVDALEKGLEQFDIPGIFTKNCIPTQKYAISSLEKIEEYPSPYFMEMDLDSMDTKYLYVETSRGCPYQCSYCLSSAQGGVRLFSLSYVQAILDNIFQSNVKQIKFLDRTFNVDKNRAIYLANYINEHAKKDQSFQFEIMAEHLSEELITFLENRQSGPKFRFEIGIQTTNTHSLREIHRVQDFEKLSKVIARLSKSKQCELHVDLIAGLPLEDYESFHKSFNDVYSLNPDELQLGFLKLLRGTLMKQSAQDYQFKYSEEAPYEIRETAWLSVEDLDRIRDVAYALENLYNKKRMCHTLKYLITNYQADPFVLFEKIGNVIRKSKPKNYHALFSEVLEILSHVYPQKVVSGLLNEEYYALSKQRVKRIVPFVLENKEAILQQLVEAGIGNVNALINYGVFALGVEGILFVLYNKEQTFPKIYEIHTNGKVSLKERA